MCSSVYQQALCRYDILLASFIKFLIGFHFQTYFFARDDKLYKAFQERVGNFRDELATLDPQLQEQVQVLKGSLEGRTLSYRVRVRTPYLCLSRT